MGRARLCVFVTIAAVLSSAGGIPARAAAPSLVPVTDPQKMFTISFPASWTVHSAETTGRVLRGKVTRRDQPVLSIMTAQSPDNADDYPAGVVVMAKRLDKPLSLSALTEEFSEELDEGETATLLQEGRTRIGGREAYYRYQMLHEPSGAEVYLVVVYVSTGRVGFMVMGAAKQDRRETDLPLILRIIESLRPA